jgi:hypothetical protein
MLVVLVLDSLSLKYSTINVKMGRMCGIKLEVVRNKDFHMVHVAHNICGSGHPPCKIYCQMCQVNTVKSPRPFIFIIGLWNC